MSFTDDQLKQALAKMLPEWIEWREIKATAIGTFESYFCLCWLKGCHVLNTEFLHICWLVEQTIDLDNGEYSQALQEVCGVSEESFCPIVDKAIIHSSWQQRTIALAKVKGVEI